MLTTKEIYVGQLIKVRDVSKEMFKSKSKGHKIFIITKIDFTRELVKAQSLSGLIKFSWCHTSHFEAVT